MHSCKLLLWASSMASADILQPVGLVPQVGRYTLPKTTKYSVSEDGDYSPPPRCFCFSLAGASRRVVWGRVLPVRCPLGLSLVCGRAEGVRHPVEHAGRPTVRDAVRPGAVRGHPQVLQSFVHRCRSPNPNPAASCLWVSTFSTRVACCVDVLKRALPSCVRSTSCCLAPMCPCARVGKFLLMLALFVPTLLAWHGMAWHGRTLLSLPWYRGHIDGSQEVMIGYSDSAKDAGRMAAAWAQYNAQVRTYCNTGSFFQVLY